MVPLILGVQARAPQQHDRQANPLSQRNAVVNRSFFSFDPTSKWFESTLCHTVKLLFQQTVWLPVCDSLSPSQRQQSREYNLLHHALSILMFSNKINIQMHVLLLPHRTHFKLRYWKETANPQRQHWLQKEGNAFLPHNDLKGVDRAQWSFSLISKKKNVQHGTDSWHSYQRQCEHRF